MLIRHYKRRELGGKQDYFFQLATKEISFKVCDKIYEPEQNDRCPKEHRKQKVLRLEVSMQRKAFPLTWHSSALSRSGESHLHFKE